MTSAPPTLRVEKRLLRSGLGLIAACDEVGRGALGGPVSVGVVLVDASVRRPLPGVRDSKLLSAGVREALAPRIRRWVVGAAVGHASACEIDELGIITAMRLAGHRALRALPARPDLILLDGNHDYLSEPAQGSLGEPGELEVTDEALPPVTTLVKADLSCASVAAASVLAKTTRDAIMCDLAVEHPAYRWEENKGYATPAHTAALRRLGPCVQHRRSWRLPGVAGPRMPADAEVHDGPR